jgi:DGQHR domain-containing protein
MAAAARGSGMKDIPADPDKIEISFRCLKATQPIGDLYLASIPYRDLVRMTHFDVRRVIQSERDVERYLGIQRPLSKQRLADLEDYVNFLDASFPTSVIIAINDPDYVQYDPRSGRMIVRNYRKGEGLPSIPIRMVGRVIDGQHRIAGLEAFSGKAFDMPVTIFVGADIADQAHIFSTVNLEQTKVHKNLVYDLYELARTRSPQKTAHNITVTLDRDEDGPLYHRIKRLGGATEGRVFEPISQATFVEGLLANITSDPKGDRDLLLRGLAPEPAKGDGVFKLVFRNMFLTDKDLDILTVVNNYFSAVRDRWPEAWADRGRGAVLNRTNGVRALLRFIRNAYLKVGVPGDVVVTSKFLERVFKPLPLQDADFTVENFPPGTSGEAKLYRILRGQETL